MLILCPKSSWHQNLQSLFHSAQSNSEKLFPLKKRFIFKVCIFVGGCECERGCRQRPAEVVGGLGTAVRMFVNCPTPVPGLELGSSRGEYNTLLTSEPSLQAPRPPIKTFHRTCSPQQLANRLHRKYWSLGTPWGPRHGVPGKIRVSTHSSDRFVTQLFPSQSPLSAPVFLVCDNRNFSLKMRGDVSFTMTPSR